MYEVRWSQEAWDEITELIFAGNPARREQIADAMREVERVLSEAPEECGESREFGRRVAFVACFGFNFRVNAAKQTVLVLDVWLNPGSRI